MLNGLDLFSGIGGLTQALAPWVRPFAYCENDRYAQACLVSRMAEGTLPLAPIWDDVRTLHRGILAGHTTGQHDDGETVDIIYGGFPCQDISVAGNGAGLAGERSGLFWEIIRLCGELRPDFVFLENVPAITYRGGREVVGAFTSLGYDCRWCVIPAFPFSQISQGERWFILAKTKGTDELIPLPNTAQNWKPPPQLGRLFSNQRGGEAWGASDEPKPRMGRVAHGVPCRVDRIKCLGNAVVPAQARKAFEILSGMVRGDAE